MTPRTFVVAGLLALFAAPSVGAQEMLEQDTFAQVMISEVHVASTEEIGARELRADSRLADLNRPVTEIRIERLPHGDDVPLNQAADLFGDQPIRQVTATLAPAIQTDRYTTCIAYEPLYLEQRNLERCGRHLGVLQNAVSLAQFSSRSLVLPCLVARQPPSVTDHAPGECRTGQCFPSEFRRSRTAPLVGQRRLQGAIAQAGALAGFTFLLL